MAENKWALIFPFDSDHPEFARGWEAACLFMTLDNEKPRFMERTLHATNQEMVSRICEHAGYRFDVETLVEDWIVVRFQRLDS